MYEEAPTLPLKSCHCRLCSVRILKTAWKLQNDFADLREPERTGRIRMDKDKKLENIPTHELQEDIELLITNQMNKVSIFSLSHERNCADTVALSEASVDRHDSSFFSDSSLLGESVPRVCKKLLILDLNGLLADIVSRPRKNHKPDIYIAKRGVFRRPFCVEFLRFCFERFEVAVWSSRTEKNVEKVVDFLMGDLKHKLLFCWDQSHCTATSFKTLENKHKDLVFKELKKVWEKDDPKLSWKKGDYNESNTLLVDDSPYKGLLNPPNTTIYPPSYNFQDSSDHSLGPGGDLRDYLQKIAEADNVQSFVELHPFGQSAITKECESWDFYTRVMNSLSL